MSDTHRQELMEKSSSEKGASEGLPVSPNLPARKYTAQTVFCYRWWTPVLWVLGLVLVAFAIVVPVLLKLKPWKPDDPSFQFRDNDNQTYPFVSVDELVELMEQGVTVLDAREPSSTLEVQAGLNRNIPGFARSRWTDFMDGDELKSAEDIAQGYRDRGVMNDRPVVVYGGWAAENFWGEEGRIWWQLYWLNHPDARILYGGIWAWDSRIHTGSGSRGEQGDFTPDPVAERLISTADVLDIVQNRPNDTMLIDVRALSEYNGAAPFGSEYGGHIAGAFSYPWREVFGPEGNLRPLEDIRAEVMALDTRGFDESRQIIVYCTMGVRASFATSTFIGAGFDVTVHEGSWQEWTREVPQALSASLQATQG